MGVTKTDAYTADQIQLASLFKALAHPARIAILQKLLEVDCCICRDFSDEIALSQPTISRHLKELKKAGLIAGSVAGTSISYCIAAGKWQQVQQTLNRLFDSFPNGCC